MNQTIKGNIKLMVFFSILISIIMTAVAIGALYKAHSPLIMMPFSIFFFLWGLMPYLSWKRTFAREMTFTPKGIEFQLKPGNVIFIPWSDVQAVGMGANSTIYFKDGRKLVVFWTGIGIPEGCNGLPIFKAQSPEINALKPRPWLTPVIMLILLFVAMQSGLSISKPISYIIIALFSATGIYKIGIYLRDYIYRS